MTSPAASRLFIREHSRHATRKPWYDWYAVVFVVVMAGVYAYRALSGVVSRLLAPPGQVTGLAGAGAGMVVLAAAGLVGAACALGPVTIPLADVSWLLLTPLQRRGVLARSARAALAAGAVVGAGLGVVALAVIGPPGILAARLALAVLTGGGLGVCAVAVAVASQASPAGRRVLLTSAAAVACATAAGVVGAARWPAVSHAALSGALGDVPAGAVVAAVSVAGAVVLAGRAWRLLRRFPAAVVVESSSRASTVRSATAFLSVSLLAGAADNRYWRRHRLTSRAWPRLPAPAVAAWLDWRRMSRRRLWLAGLMASGVMPAVLGVATGREGVVLATSVLAGSLTVAATGAAGARQDADDPAFARLLGGGARARLAARAVLPSLLAAAWLAIALEACVLAGVVAGGLWSLLGMTASGGAAAGALRMVRSGPIDWTMPVIDTPMGTFPTALQGRAFCFVVAGFGESPLLTTLLLHRPVSGATIGAQVILTAVTLGLYLLASPVHGR